MPFDISFYRPRSRGDNTFGSIRPSVRLWTLPKITLEHLYRWVFKLVALSILLLFRQVGHLRSITLLILFGFVFKLKEKFTPVV